MKPEELQTLKQQLIKSVDSQKDSVTVDVLSQLSLWTATPELLKSLRIGVVVNDIRKNATSSQKAKDLARDLVGKWKNDIAKKDVSVPVRRTEVEEEDATTPTTLSSQTPSALPRTISSDGLSLPSTRDKIRDKCTEMIYGVLATGSDADGHHVLKKAQKVEFHVFEEFKTADGKYKAKIRSLISNLRDKNNPELRASIVDGRLDPEKFSKMTPEEMMSKDKRKQVEEAIKASIHEAVSAADNQSETDMFKCGRCKQRKTKYYQMQTRSADEPMTTFVTCINCGNRWKFC